MENKLLVLSERLVLVALVLLLFGLPSTEVGLTYASIAVAATALVPLGLAVLVLQEKARGGRRIRRRK